MNAFQHNLATTDEQTLSERHISRVPNCGFRGEVAGRFGVLPNFFCSAETAPGLIEELWGFAKSAYLDSPLPSLFKERLFVHLSRFCEVRYCIVRHIGFLIGKGRPSGDADAPPETVDQVIALLSRPIPDAAGLAAALDRLRAQDRSSAMPQPETQAEADLFDALTVIFVEPGRSERTREAVRAAVGDAAFEILVAYLAFIRTAHYWTETHPELAYEPDMLEVMEERPDLTALLLDPSDAERVKTRRDLRPVLAELHQTEAALRTSESRLQVLVGELQHRTRNLIGVVRAIADTTVKSSTDLGDFRVKFRDRLAALARVQGLLSRLTDGERVTFDDLIRAELSALGVLDDSGRVTLEGPSRVGLRSSTVQTFALALHELATNAAKYGALKQSGGHLAVRWRLDRAPETREPWLHVDWDESGVVMPAGDAVPTGGGSGRTLIERALPYQLGARTTYVMGPDGVRCTISLPASKRTEAPEAGHVK